MQKREMEKEGIPGKKKERKTQGATRGGGLENTGRRFAEPHCPLSKLNIEVRAQSWSPQLPLSHHCGPKAKADVTSCQAWKTESECRKASKYGQRALAFPRQICQVITPLPRCRELARAVAFSSAPWNSEDCDRQLANGGFAPGATAPGCWWSYSSLKESSMEESRTRAFHLLPHGRRSGRDIHSVGVMVEATEITWKIPGVEPALPYYAVRVGAGNLGTQEHFSE